MGQTDEFLNLDQEITHDDSLSGDRPTLIDALRYYADEQNYDENGAPGNFVGTASGDVWELDEGKIAKEVLKLIKKEVYQQCNPA